MERKEDLGKGLVASEIAMAIMSSAYRCMAAGKPQRKGQKDRARDLRKNQVAPHLPAHRKYSTLHSTLVMAGAVIAIGLCCVAPLPSVF